MTRAFRYLDGKATELAFEEAVSLPRGGGLLWLHVDGRDAAACAWLDAQTDIPDVARSALTAAETRPRSAPIDHGAIINLRGLGKTPEDDPDALTSVRMWAEGGRVVSLCRRTPLALDPVIADFMSGSILDPGDLLTGWAVRITEELDPHVAALGDSLDDLEATLEMKMRRQVSRIRADAIAYRRFVAPQRMALEGLANSPCGWLDDRDRLNLREASDRFARMAEELEAVRERAAIVHEELTDLRAEHMDARALFISVIALIFLPLTFVTGLFGMNFDYMPFRHMHEGFMATVVGCLAAAIVMTVYFTRRHWLDRA